MNRMASVIAASITTALAGTAVVAALTSDGVVGGDGAPKNDEATVVVVDSTAIDGSQPVTASVGDDVASPDDPDEVDDQAEAADEPDEVDDQAEAADDPDEVDDQAEAADEPDEADDQAEAADDPDGGDDDSSDARELEPHEEDDDGD